MVPGGGHRKNNPHDYVKGPKRGDKNREKDRGRKRIAQVDRPKATSPVPLVVPITFEDFTEDDAKVIYALDKGKNYGDRSKDLEQLSMNRQIRKNKIPEFMESFKRKLEARDWGSVYVGDDDKTYVSLNPEKVEIIRQYTEIMKQSSASDIVRQ